MRIAVGRMSHEANTFSSQATDRSHFGVQVGPELLEGLAGTNTELAGAMSVLAAVPELEVIPLMGAKAGSGGPLPADTFRELLDDLLSQLRAVLPVDGVLLGLHGAMMAEGEPDATGALLQEVRQLVGTGVPVVGTLDLHANVTRRMVAQATALVGYHTAPHIDMFDTGKSAAQILMGTLAGKLSPTMALARLPMLIPPENSRHTDGPLSEVISQALALEQDGTILHGSIYPVQPWMDTEDVASSVLIVTNGDQDLARSICDRLAHDFWDRRAQFVPEMVAPDEAFRLALARESGTVIFCDSADAPSSGGTGDSAVVLKAALNAAPFVVTALLNLVDPVVVAQAIEAGVGATVTVEVGGKLAPDFFQPVSFTGRVRLISDGAFRFKGPGMRGVEHHMGRVVVLVQGGIHLVVMERGVTQWDPQLYRSLGEEPGDARVVQVRSPAAFRAAYAGIADEILIIASPGASSSRFEDLPWYHLPRPIYPLDPDTTWPR